MEMVRQDANADGLERPPEGDLPVGLAQAVDLFDKKTAAPIG